MPSIWASQVHAHFTSRLRSMAASPSAHLLAPLLEQGGQLACLCDAKAAGGQSYYRLNDERVSQLSQWVATGHDLDCCCAWVQPSAES